MCYTTLAQNLCIFHPQPYLHLEYIDLAEIVDV